jgi:hypothetical protein
MKAAKAAKIVTAVFLFYVGIVVLFESLLGYFQPQAGTAMVITTFDNENNGNDRVVARLESNSMIYVARITGLEPGIVKQRLTQE